MKSTLKILIIHMEQEKEFKPQISEIGNMVKEIGTDNDEIVLKVQNVNSLV
jgi:hypothetical protein